jgi:YkoY family integral membrane protein
MTILNFLQEHIFILVSLAFIEILLSVDNAIVNASLAEPLPTKQRKLALMIGILAGAGLRVVALIFATIITQNKWILVIGGVYLIYISFTHIFISKKEEQELNKEKGHFAIVIAQIAFADLIFSIDNVVSAVGLSHERFVLISGVLIGIFAMLFLSQIVSRIIHKNPHLKKAAYIIIGLIGWMIIYENIYHLHITETIKFTLIIAVILGTYFFGKKKIDINQDIKI